MQIHIQFKQRRKSNERKIFISLQNYAQESKIEWPTNCSSISAQNSLSYWGQMQLSLKQIHQTIQKYKHTHTPTHVVVRHLCRYDIAARRHFGFVWISQLEGLMLVAFNRWRGFVVDIYFLVIFVQLFERPTNWAVGSRLISNHQNFRKEFKIIRINRTLYIFRFVHDWLLSKSPFGTSWNWFSSSARTSTSPIQRISVTPMNK